MFYIFLILRRYLPLPLLLMACVQFSFAGDVHTNQMEMKRHSATSLSMDFFVDPAKFCYLLMAPHNTYEYFLKFYSEMPAEEFKKEWSSSIKKLESENFIMMPSGVKVPLKQWTFPSEDALQGFLKKAQLIIGLPANFRSHLEPVLVTAVAQSKTPLNRVQLNLSQKFHPILVQYKQDRVWLTSQIPVELFDL